MLKIDKWPDKLGGEYIYRHDTYVLVCDKRHESFHIDVRSESDTLNDWLAILLNQMGAKTTTKLSPLNKDFPVSTPEEARTGYH